MARKLRRFTPAEDEVIRTDWAAYVSTDEIAKKLGRDEGTLRQRIFMLGLRRDALVSHALRWAPPHLAARAGAVPDEAFLAACHAWRDEQRALIKAHNVAEHAAISKEIEAQCAAIDQRTMPA